VVVEMREMVGEAEEEPEEGDAAEEAEGDESG